MSSRQLRIYALIFIILILAVVLSIIKLKTQISLLNSSALQTNTASTLVETQAIDWTTTTQLMADCQVKSVFQNHQLQVILRTYDNQIFQTTENKIDDIFKLAKKYQGPCDIIQQITE